MGRITVFSADGCPHCKRVKVALSSRNIPFAEVSVTKYPKKRQDMLALSDRVSTPQVFFNTRHVGGADETIALLETWDKEKKQAYASPYERYMVEIGDQFDPTNPRLSLPEEEPVKLDSAPDRRTRDMSVVFPDGKAATVFETTEFLKKILKSGDTVQNLKKEKMTFTGKQAVSAFSTQFSVCEEKAIAFGVQLQEKQILHSIRNRSEFDNSDTLFRLQCYSNPEILNSYRIWNEKNMSTDPVLLVNRLTVMMNHIEVMVTDDYGNVDYEKAVSLPLYSDFEESVCELQDVHFICMDDRTKTVSLRVFFIIVILQSSVTSHSHQISNSTPNKYSNEKGTGDQFIQSYDQVCVHESGSRKERLAAVCVLQSSQVLCRTAHLFLSGLGEWSVTR